ncbi:MAG: hypothetical protein V1663_05495 [archaeon]
MNLMKLLIILCAVIGLILPLGLNILPNLDFTNILSLLFTVFLAFFIEIVFMLVGAALGAIIGLVLEGLFGSLRDNF